MPSHSAKLPLAKMQDLVIQDLEDELLIFNLKSNKALSLNKTLKLVWESCDGKTGISEIAEKLSLKLNQPVSKELILLAVEQLKKENLLADGEDLHLDLAGLSRREMIKKVGLASAVALPMICVIVAPTAANAQSSSLFANGAACSENSECSSSNCQDVCCSSISTSNAAAPGYYFGGSSCRTTDAACQSDWASACCSGKASLSTISGLCFFGGEFQCECDPY